MSDHKTPTTIHIGKGVTINGTPARVGQKIALRPFGNETMVTLTLFASELDIDWKALPPGADIVPPDDLYDEEIAEINKGQGNEDDRIITTFEQLAALPVGTILVDHDVTAPSFYDLVVISKSGFQDRHGTGDAGDFSGLLAAHGGALRIVELGG